MSALAPRQGKSIRFTKTEYLLLNGFFLAFVIVVLCISIIVNDGASIIIEIPILIVGFFNLFFNRTMGEKEVKFSIVASIALIVIIALVLPIAVTVRLPMLLLGIAFLFLLGGDLFLVFRHLYRPSGSTSEKK